MSGIFINYRGDDSQTAAALIDRELTAQFGNDQVFLVSIDMFSFTRPGAEQRRRSR
jgi:hypothetical protein